MPRTNSRASRNFKKYKKYGTEHKKLTPPINRKKGCKPKPSVPANLAFPLVARTKTRRLAQNFGGKGQKLTSPKLSSEFLDYGNKLYKCKPCFCFYCETENKLHDKSRPDYHPLVPINQYVKVHNDNTAEEIERFLNGDF